MSDTRLRLAYAAFSAALAVHVLAYGLSGARGASFWIAGAPLALGGLLTAIAALTWPRWAAFARQAGGRWRPLIGLAGLAACVGFGILARPEWVYAHGALWLALTAGAAWSLLRPGDGEASASRSGPRWWIGAAVVAIVAVIGVRLAGLSVYPLMNTTDEPWVLGWALSYARTGTLNDMILAWGGYPVAPFMILPGLWIRAFGADFWTARVFFFGGTLLLAALSGLAGWRLYDDRRIGLLAGIFVFASAVVMGGARIRHDIGLALALAASLWAFAEGQRRRAWAFHLGAGFLIAIGGLAHLHAAVFGPVLAAALFGPGLLRREPKVGVGLAAFIGGGIAGALIVFAALVLPTLAGGGSPLQTARTAGTLGDFLNMAAAYVGVVGRFSLIELALVVAAAAAALWRAGRVDLSIGLAIVFGHLGIAFAANSLLIDYYVLPLAPLYAIAAAGLFVYGLRRQPTPERTAQAGFATGAFAAAAALSVTLAVPLTHLIGGGPVPLQPTATMAWLRENAPADQAIVAQHEYFLFLNDRRFLSPFSTSLLSPAERAQFPQDADAWDALAPEWVVIDRNRADFCFAMVICQEGYLQTRGYRAVATFPGEREPVIVYQHEREDAG